MTVESGERSNLALTLRLLADTNEAGRHEVERQTSVAYSGNCQASHGLERPRVRTALNG